MEENISLTEKLRKNMDLYKSKLTDKYNRAYTSSKRKKIAGELLLFSSLYKDLFGEDNKFVWDNDTKIYNCCNNTSISDLLDFVDSINDKNNFYLNLSNNVINSFKDVNYPFYRYFSGIIINNPRLDNVMMLELVLAFLNNFDSDIYLDMREKMVNLELLDICLEDDFSGFTYPISSLRKNFILLNNLYEDNIYKYSVISHEYGHSYEMKLAQNSSNDILVAKAFKTPFTEISSCFFEYSFLNYLKENKIYTNYVNQCLDNYFMEMLRSFFKINIISKFPDLEVNEDGLVNFNDVNIIKYGDKIKEKLNYYIFPDYDEEVVFRFPYIYGLGKLFSIYLYENYKENPEFFKEFRKSLLNYPLVNDISVFNNVGINEDILLKGDVLKKVLKKHSEDFVND